MKAKFITSKGNKDGSMTLYFESGLDRHALLDMEGCEVSIVADEQIDMTDPVISYLSKQIESIRKEAYNKGLMEAALEMEQTLLGGGKDA